MSWREITPASVVRVRTNAKSLLVSLPHELLAELRWKPNERLGFFIGENTDAGYARISPGSPWALRDPGGGTSARQRQVHIPLGVVNAPADRHWTIVSHEIIYAEVDVVEADLIIRLPDWLDKPRSATAAPVSAPAETAQPTHEPIAPGGQAQVADPLELWHADALGLLREYRQRKPPLLCEEIATRLTRKFKPRQYTKSAVMIMAKELGLWDVTRRVHTGGRGGVRRVLPKTARTTGARQEDVPPAASGAGEARPLPAAEKAVLVDAVPLPARPIVIDGTSEIDAIVSVTTLAQWLRQEAGDRVFTRDGITINGESVTADQLLERANDIRRVRNELPFVLSHTAPANASLTTA